MHRGWVLLCVAFTAGLTAPMAVAQTAEEQAAAFLEAWVFQDHAAMWEALDDPSRQDLSAEVLGERLQAVPLLIEEFEIVSTAADGEALRVRYRLHGVHTGSGERTALPGTLRVVPDGDGPGRVEFTPPAVNTPIVIPSVDELVERAQSAARNLVPNPLPPTQVIDGVSIDDVLAHAAQRHGQVQTMRTELVMRGSAMGQGVDLTGDLLYRAPNQMRLDLGEALFITDGVRATMYIRPANAYFNLPLAMGADLMSFAPGLGQAVSSINASLVGREIVGGREAWHLAVAPSGQGGIGAMGMAGMATAMGAMHVWIDTETALPRRARIGAMGTSLEINFGEVRVNTGDVAADAFEFQPPPGAMEIPMLLPMMGGS